MVPVSMAVEQVLSLRVCPQHDGLTSLSPRQRGEGEPGGEAGALVLGHHALKGKKLVRAGKVSRSL